MSVEQPSTQGTPSRASTMVRDTIEEGQPATAAPSSVLQGVYPTPPRATPTQEDREKRVAIIKDSMQHVITILYGDDLRNRISIHEQTLCKHSKKMTDFAVKATEFRDAYYMVNEWCDQIESVTVLNASPKQFEAQRLGAQLIPLILKIWDHFPVAEYQKPISKAIREAVDDQYTSSNLMPTAEKPKTLKMFQDFSSNKRLDLLNSEGLLEVAEEAFTRLQKFKRAEKHLAKKNVVKTWALGQLFVRNTTEKSVVSLVKWAYHQELNFENTEHLYDLCALATRLQFDVLAEECMTQLYDTASASLRNASSNGIPLRSLLGLSNEQNHPEAAAHANDVVATVFHHVLKDEKSPEKLSLLIMDTLARGMDTELWVQIRAMVSLDTALALIDYMITYRDMKVEGGLEDCSVVKPEPTEAQQSALTG